MIIKKIIFYLFLGCLLGSLTSCYSFTGSSLSPEVKTIKIPNFPNNAPLFNADLSQNFTTNLQNKFLQTTHLKGTNENPDILLEGEITDYVISPTNISSTVTSTTGGNLQATQNKLTITVKVHYENKLDPKANFDRTYSDEATFSTDLSQQQIETGQVKIVNDRIITKIYNDIVANW